MKQIRPSFLQRWQRMGYREMLPFVFVLGIAVLWGLIENLSALLPSSYSAYQVVWARYGIHLFFLMLIWIPRRKKNLVKTLRWKGQILRGLLMLGMPVFFLLAIRSMPDENVWSIFWLAPIVGMIISFFILKEPANKRMWVAAGIAFIGPMIVLRPTLAISLHGFFWSLGMMGCFSLYLFASRKLAKEDILTSLFYTAAAVFIPLTVVMPFVWKAITVQALIVMALIGLSGLGLLFLLDQTLETTWIVRVAPLLSTEPVWYSLINSILFRTPVHIRDVAVGLVILAAGGWACFSMTSRDFQSSPDPKISYTP